MIGWIVEKTSRSGWRMKWRRLRARDHARVRDRRHGSSPARVAAPRRRAGRGSRRPGVGRGRRRGRRGSGPPSSLGGAPVSCRNTSSSVGRRSPRSLTRDPLGAAPKPPPRSARDRHRVREASAVRALARFGITAADPTARAWLRRVAPRWSSSTSRIWPPIRSLSSFPVPCAITRPWSITAMRSAS